VVSAVRPSRWRFGLGQTVWEERREIAEAKRAGLADGYLRGQRWARMIEAERERRRGSPRSWVAIDGSLDEAA
jgi:hypothetical protein